MAFDVELIIYTDGSSLQSPRNGGIGIRFLTIDSAGNEQDQDIQPWPGYGNGYIFDKNNNPKPSYYAMLKLLKSP